MGNTTTTIKEIDEAGLKDLLGDKTTIVIDTRGPPLFNANFIVGSVSIPPPVFDKFGPAILNHYSNVVVIDTPDNAKKVAEDLGKKGGITVKGWFNAEKISGVKLPVKSIDKTDPNALAEILKTDKDVLVLDVRTPTECDATGVVKGSINIPLGELAGKLGEVPKDKKIITHCAGGVRAVTAYSLLLKENYENVSALACSFDDIKNGGAEIVKKTA